MPIHYRCCRTFKQSCLSVTVPVIWPRPVYTSDAAEYQNRLPAGAGMQLALEIPLLWRDYRVESSSFFVSGQLNLLPAVTADSQPAVSRDLPMYGSGLRLPGFTILLILACFLCEQCMCLHLAPNKHCLAMVLASQKSSFKKFGLNVHKYCSEYLPTSELPG